MYFVYAAIGSTKSSEDATRSLAAKQKLLRRSWLSSEQRLVLTEISIVNHTSLFAIAGEDDPKA